MQRVIYVSYDGAAEPLGQSQVVAYLERLARDVDVTLISFEKRGDGSRSVERRLEAAGVKWIRLRYHRRPAVISTLWDVLVGVRLTRREIRRKRADIVHVRSYVPALMASVARRGTGARLLFDIRGFWRDERLDAGFWRRGGAIDRVVHACERRFFREADAIVTLTEASVPRLRDWTLGRPVPVEVIPTCVDTAAFQESTPRPDGPHAVWTGSLGAWYRFDLAVLLAEALDLPFTVLTRQVEPAREALDGRPADVRTVNPPEMTQELHAGDIGLCLIRSSFSKVASAPTRFAEYLAAGMPVAVTPGIGDLDEIVEREGVGVTIRAEDKQALLSAADTLKAMAGDADIRERCQRIARERFDVNAGADRYASLYRMLINGRFPFAAGASGSLFDRP